jgi:hypothetical protein
MIAATASFSAGFLLGQAWAILAFRHALGGSDVFSWRFLIVLAIETAVAALAFLFASRVGRLRPSAGAYVVAAATGVVTNAVTVGAYAQVPIVVQGDAQLVLYVAAVGLLSAIAGWLLTKMFRVEVPHAA